MESILIVDDERDNLEALRRLLRQEFAVTTTESGLEALKLISTQEFAVIVSDQRMPQITGVDLLEKAKALRPATSRILLTGYTEVESVIGAINRGNIYRYLAKPWDPEDLKITLRQASESYRLKKDVEEKNAALEKANQELQQALDALRLLDRAKARFLSLVSHELNTPLTALTAFVELLGQSKNEFSADVQRAIASLSGASQRLSEIIQDVLSYVRLESESAWPLQNFNWEKETGAVVQELARPMAAKSVTCTLHGAKGLVSRCNPEKMRLAIGKLISEAIQRSPKGESVGVHLSRKGTQTVFQVNWKGASLEPQVFQALEASADEMHHHRNLALGLAIAKRIAQLYGGDLTPAPVTDPKVAGVQMRIVDAKHSSDGPL